MKWVIAILYIVCTFAAFVMLGFVYDWLRRKQNKPRIGFHYFLCRLLKSGDYVSINGKILCFSHITGNGEVIDHIQPPSNSNMAIAGDLAFENPHSLGYLIYPVYTLNKCEFIYGKYGLKWAASNEFAKTAKEKINEYLWN